MPNAVTGRLLQCSILLLVLAAHLTTRAQNGFEWKDRYGNTCNRSDLDEILRKHRQWVDSEEKSGTQAELNGADLSGAYLYGAKLTRAELAGAKLTKANLSAADLTYANVKGADLTYANLSSATLIDTDLSKANLTKANLTYAKLTPSNLSEPTLTLPDLSGATLIEADLSNANLTKANLVYSDLTGATLSYANLSGAMLINTKLIAAKLFDTNLTEALLSDADLTDGVLTLANLTDARLDRPKLTGADLTVATLVRTKFEPVSLPELRGIAAAQHLELLTFDKNPDALVQLRKQFEDDGFRGQERKITYALKRREAELAYEACSNPFNGRAALWSSDSVVANCGSFVLNKVFFDWTCQYGMSPGRPLIFGIVLWLVCSLLYFLCLQRSGETGLYRVYEKPLSAAPAAPCRFEKISISSIRRFRSRQGALQFLRDEWLLLRASMFFSLMSAFNIGFRDINFGRWLRLLTRQEFDIKAVGWTRVVAGWQSLMSVYLLALWVLTYFGRPFG
jgi:uncharacterized protein YjbI with pentapeptide repeats